MISEEEKISLKRIRHVTMVGFWVNAALMVLKLIVGYLGHSEALVADGYHSLSDFATDLAVLVFVGLAFKQADSDHPYGHGKFETLASLLISIALIGVAVGIGMSGIRTIQRFHEGEAVGRPDIWTLAVALLSILGKEWLYHYTVRAGRSEKSSSLVANAWHHRSDAISSIATVIGITLSILLGDKWSICDPIASLLIAIFILISALKLAGPALNELLEKGLPPEEIANMEKVISLTPGVIRFHRLRARHNGRYTIAEVHIKVNPDITVTEGHKVATDVEQNLKKECGDKLIATVHVEPAGQESQVK